MDWKNQLMERHMSDDGIPCPECKFIQDFISTEIIEKLLTEVGEFNSHGRFIEQQVRNKWL